MRPPKGNGSASREGQPVKTLSRRAADFKPCFLITGGQAIPIRSRTACDAGFVCSFDLIAVLEGYMDGGAKAIRRALSRLDRLSPADRQDAYTGLVVKLIECWPGPKGFQASGGCHD